MTTNTNTPAAPTAPAAELVISYPSRGGFTTASNFTQGCTPYVTAENLGRTQRDVFLGEDLVGFGERQEGSWWFDVAGCPTLELANLRSMRRATAALLAHVTEHNPDLLAPPVDVAAPADADADDGWSCDDCGDLIDSASTGCVNPHCGETPDERRLRESIEADAALDALTVCTVCREAIVCLCPATPATVDVTDSMSLLPFVAAADRAHRLAAVVFLATRLHTNGAHGADLLQLIADLPGLTDDDLGDLVTDLIDPVVGDGIWSEVFRMTAAILGGTTRTR